MEGKGASSGIDTRGHPILQGMVRGLLPLYILELLLRAPAHGIGIAASIHQMNGGTWSPSPGSLYPTLRKLEQQGLIAGRWLKSSAADKRVYEITQEGRTARARLRDELLNELSLARKVLDIHYAALTRPP